MKQKKDVYVEHRRSIGTKNMVPCKLGLNPRRPKNG
jgi:hypothetical protein